MYSAAMNVYLLDHTVLGRETEFPRRVSNLGSLIAGVRGVSITGLINRADLVIFVIDRPHSGDKMFMLTQLQNRKPVWYFFPRGDHVMPDIALAAFGDKHATSTVTLHPITRFFPYDSSTDVVSWLRSSLMKTGVLAHFAPEQILKEETAAVGEPPCDRI